MELLKTLAREAVAGNKRFVLIGGHALSIHGISRSTGDVDLMVERGDAPFWKNVLLRLGYVIFQETSAFIQTKPPRIDTWPIDLMLVSGDTMNKACKDAKETDQFGPKILAASVGNLIAMKIHALKSNQEHRMQKDQADLFALLALADIRVESEAVRQLCLKYGTIELYERLKTGRNS